MYKERVLSLQTTDIKNRFEDILLFSVGSITLYHFSSRSNVIRRPKLVGIYKLFQIFRHLHSVIYA